MEDTNKYRTALHLYSSVTREGNINTISATNMDMKTVTETERQVLLAEGKVEYRHMDHQAPVFPGKPPG
jgi:hypothetical protein